jgi:hypothetical protein
MAESPIKPIAQDMLESLQDWDKRQEELDKNLEGAFERLSVRFSDIMDEFIQTIKTK